MRLLLALFFILPLCLVAQFAPAVGQLGCSAIAKDSSSIIAWVDSCYVTRGWQDISNKNLGKTTYGKDSSALGDVNLSNGVVSLGDSGIAICFFKNSIKNGNGPDFAVFENSFDNYFLELAFVEVSSDGIHYKRFPATSNTDTLTQINGFGQLAANELNNLAGKYRAGYGTPFDLNLLQNNLFFNKDSVHYIKLIDVVGSLQNSFCSKDQNGKKINDPFPTPFASGGFDLDGIGVIHQRLLVNTDDKILKHSKIKAVPTISSNEVNITGLKKYYHNTIIARSIENKILAHINTKAEVFTLDISHFTNGIYFLEVNDSEQIIYLKIVKQ
jgi:hypothetical protein